MKCPNCGTTLLMTVRSEVEIDYCPECRGIWLDKGELDRLIERAETSYQPQRSVPPVNEERPYVADAYLKRKRDDDYDDYDSHYDNRPRKKSMLGNIFDIFD